MNLHTYIENLIRQCQEVIDKTENIYETKGRIDFSISHGQVQYKHVYKNDKGRMVTDHIPNENLDIVKSVLQSKYERDIRKLAISRKRKLSKLHVLADQNGFEEIYKNIHPYRQMHIKPIVDSYENRIKKWKSIPYTTLGFKDSDKKFKTKNGLTVRSKTERTLTDLFDSYGLTYKYEYPIYINGRTRYVDFAFLDPNSDQIIYWEHFGMMNNPQYSVAAYKKLIEYDKNGIRQGHNLIVTYEDSDNDLDYDYVNMLIKRYLLRK